MGGRIVGALVLAMYPKRFGLDVKLQRLHSTKGWKVAHIERWKGATPVVGRFHWADGCGPHRVEGIFEPIITPRMLLRHGWYRRKLRQRIAFGVATEEERKELCDMALSEASREAHSHPERRAELRTKIDGIYLTICGDEAFDVMVAKDRLAEIGDGATPLITGDALKAELDSLLAE